jgi:tetratricopeptide (TPR) repeat protein
MTTLAHSRTVDASQARLQRLQAFLDNDPENPRLSADLADLALECGEIELARATIQRVLDRHPSDPYFGLRLSSVAIAGGNFDEALTLTEALLAAGYDDVAIRYNQAYALFNLRRFAEAKTLLQALYQAEVPFPLGVRLLIRAHHYLGEVAEAISVATAFLAAHPENSDVAGMLSLLYFDDNDLAAAREWSQRALADAPQNLDALLAAGGAALGAEDAQTAKTLLLQAVSVQPRNGRVWANLGLADMLNLDLDSAEEKLLHAVKYMPEHIGTWHVLGWVQLLKKNINGADTSFQTALALDENFGETHGGLAAVAAARGDWATAERCSKTARRLDPQSMSANYAQILQMQSMGRTDLAQRLLEGALRQGHSPAGGNLLEMVGRVVGKRRR